MCAVQLETCRGRGRVSSLQLSRTLYKKTRVAYGVVQSSSSILTKRVKLRL